MHTNTLTASLRQTEQLTAGDFYGLWLLIIELRCRIFLTENQAEMAKIHLCHFWEAIQNHYLLLIFRRMSLYHLLVTRFTLNY